MKVTLSLEKSKSNDLAIMVDVLRASTTIVAALDNFKKILPVSDKNLALKLSKKMNCLIAGERNGKKIREFDIGNSPIDIQKKSGEILILTTTNGTRVLNQIKCRTLIGSFINAKSVANVALKLANEHIDIVMAGVKGNFALEDFLGAGEIIKYMKNVELSEYAKSALLASMNKDEVDKAVKDSLSAKKLKKLGLYKDVEFCLKRNISNNVPYYNGKYIVNLKDLRNLGSITQSPDRSSS
ncbi:2-phosphosulfolactate phosphatase [Methanothermus fervidus DSM 2088]|uniref:2-phosphosulfolactate phosphatase n=1 Tax=Methanothermus fervidus (strain ATCC 43054 / DSM 2088 / JCM 10308 / V24 S) TaxID=523846 RepID=E3GWV3_METFV|nr:2-phosphosulfolactate phosphatase [Methanothermus fervidus]ADP78022.1 2-phosphosulfolactate phosphatase [Methanothermus fervidus DSM 2088]